MELDVHRPVQRCRRRGFTLLEVIVASTIGLLAIGLAWSLFSGIAGKNGGPGGAISMTADSFLRQDAVYGMTALTKRLQESIQIIAPAPGGTASTLTFRDVLNNQISLQCQNGVLYSSGINGPELSPVTLQSASGPFVATVPVRVPSCSAAQFTAVSPSCVMMLLSFQGEGTTTSTVVSTVDLQNQLLAK